MSQDYGPTGHKIFKAQQNSYCLSCVTQKTKLFQFLVKISPYTLMRSEMTSDHTYHFVL